MRVQRLRKFGEIYQGQIVSRVNCIDDSYIVSGLALVMSLGIRGVVILVLGVGQEPRVRLQEAMRMLGLH
jgi:hypothetical protein